MTPPSGALRAGPPEGGPPPVSRTSNPARRTTARRGHSSRSSSGPLARTHTRFSPGAAVAALLYFG